MGKLEIVKGDLIKLAKAGEFDVIGHGCNCYCRMKRGIAPIMAKEFGCDKFDLESYAEGDISKLGNIDYMWVNHERKIYRHMKDELKGCTLAVVNMYTQYHWVKLSRYEIPLDYDALRLCLRKMNQAFPKQYIGLPWIGCGLAGGDKNVVRTIIEQEMTNCQVTIVELPKSDENEQIS